MSVASRNNDHNLRFASQSRHHLPACLRVKQAVREKEGKVLMVNLAGHHQEVEHLRRLSVRRDSPKVSRKASPRDRDNHSAARKRAREAHRRQARSNFCSCSICGSGTKVPELLFHQALPAVACAVLSALVTRRARNSAEDSGPYNSSAICTAFSAAPLSN